MQYFRRDGELRPLCVKGAVAERLGDCRLTDGGFISSPPCNNPSGSAYASPPPLAQGRQGFMRTKGFPLGGKLSPQATDEGRINGLYKPPLWWSYRSVQTCVLYQKKASLCKGGWRADARLEGCRLKHWLLSRLFLVTTPPPPFGGPPPLTQGRLGQHLLFTRCSARNPPLGACYRLFIFPSSTANAVPLLPKGKAWEAEVKIGQGGYCVNSLRAREGILRSKTTLSACLRRREPSSSERVAERLRAGR